MKQVIESTYDQSTVHTEPPFFKRISWGAIFAGLTTAVIIQMLLTLLGVGIGAATVNPLQERAPGEGLGVGAAIWFFVSSIIAMYVGGRVAGRFSDASLRKDRAMHGILMWAATTILSAAFLASALSSLLGSAAGSAAAGTAVQANSTQAAPQRAASSPAVRDPAAVAVNEQEARRAGEVAAERVSQSALVTFFVLLLSGAAAALGARNTAPRSVQDEYVRRETETHATPAFAKS